MRYFLAIAVLLCGAVSVSAAFAEDAKTGQVTDQVVGLGGYLWYDECDIHECE